MGSPSSQSSLHWTDPLHALADPNLPIPQVTELRLGELRAGDAALIGLERYPSALMANWSITRATALKGYPQEEVDSEVGVTSVSSLAAMVAPGVVNLSTFFRDNANDILWVRIVTSTTEPGISLHTDGLGQVIRVVTR